MGAEIAYGNLCFDEWFESFLSATMQIHRYAVEDAVGYHAALYAEIIVTVRWDKLLGH